ncbi:DUF5641 domain-containing protein, partial [Nephila pilipes]
MNFLRQEVKGEEMVNLARTGFASHQNPRWKEFQNEQLKQSGNSQQHLLTSAELSRRAGIYETVIEYFFVFFDERLPEIKKKAIQKLKDIYKDDIESFNFDDELDQFLLFLKENKDTMNTPIEIYPIAKEMVSTFPNVEILLKIPINASEIYSKESVDGELGGEESNSNNVTDNENNVTSADAVIVRKFTSSGRLVKAPTRLDLLNNVCYTLETLSESQGGRRMLRNE